MEQLLLTMLIMLWVAILMCVIENKNHFNRRVACAALLLFWLFWGLAAW